MANSNKGVKSDKELRDIASGIQSNMDSLYQTTYFSDPQAGNDLKDIKSRINLNIDKIVNRNMNTVGMPSVSSLYSRMFNQNGTGVGKKNNEIVDGINSMFESPMMMDDLYSTFVSNRFLKELDNEIDTVCKYMPELEEALDAKKDSILSADHFSKDFLNIKYPTDLEDETFSHRCTEMKKRYNLLKVIEDMYADTAKYGETFTYKVPFDIAISKLLASKPMVSNQRPYIRQESELMNESAELGSYTKTFQMDMTRNRFSISEGESSEYSVNLKPISESVDMSDFDPFKVASLNPSILQGNENIHLDIVLNQSNIIDSAVLSERKAYNQYKKMSESSIHNEFMRSLNESDSKIASKTKASGNLNTSGLFDGTNKGTEGLVNANNGKDYMDSEFKVKVPGCVVKRLKREQCIPIYIDDNCMGYYYIELRTKDLGSEMLGFRNVMGDSLSAVSGDGRSNFNAQDSSRQEETIKYVAGQLSQFIDKKFVNNNQDLSREIYDILKYNDLFNTPSIDQIKITFVPPEDIVHSYFQLDEQSHRGISDLARGLIPAKIYSSLYITNSLAILTRGQDKRMYYVKQTVDTNIASQLLNTIAQIKQGNFGMRQFSSINNVLNITGRFNDYVIPTNASGDPPISFEIMPGQQIDIQTDLMNMCKEAAINSSGVPMDIIQARQSIDFAAQLSMSSSKFLRTIYKRQDLFQPIVSELVTAIYDYEYGESVALEVSLPPPVFLDMANTNQLVTNTTDFVNSIINIEMPNEQDQILRDKYAQKLFRHYIGTHIDISAHANILKQAKVEAKKEQDESQIVQSQSGNEDF